jgi:hypothetical protein
MLPRAQAVADELGRHRKLTLGKVLHCIKTRIFKTETADFMHAVAIGALHVGKGYGNTKDDRDEDVCLSCRQCTETLLHVFMCSQYRPIRRWTTKAVQALTGLKLIGKDLASYMAFGYSTNLLYQRGAVAVREVAMEALRCVRNACMKSPQARRPSPETLGLALRQRIRDDYWHARGADNYGDFMQAATRWHPDAYIPATLPDFNAAWRPLAIVQAKGRLDLHGLRSHGLLQQTDDNEDL